MVFALVSGLRGLGSRPCRVNVLCSLGETLNFQSASLSPPRSIDGYRRIVKEAYEIRGGGDNRGRLVFLGEIRTYLRGRTFACLHNSSIRDVGWENSQKLKNFSHSTFQRSCLDGPIYTWK